MRLEDCNEIEELAFVTSLGRELDFFFFLTADNDIKIITENTLKTFKAETLD